MQRYVAGFLFDRDRQVVALIRKQKPEWQKGKLNAIGGKIEPGESPAMAMMREFYEEAGINIDFWAHYVTLTGDGFEVYFYYAFGFPDDVTSKTEEKVGVYELEFLRYEETIPNLRWLIPMALSMAKETIDSFVVTEKRGSD